LVVYEDGVPLTRVADAATASTTPGSFVNKTGLDASPWTLQIHATGSGNPNTNGKTYEASVRNNACLFSGSGAAVSGVRAQRALSNNGAFEAGLNANVSRVLSVDGTKHNVLINSGSLTDVLAYRIDAVTSYEPSDSYFVGYVLDAAGLSHRWVRCGASSCLASGYRGIAGIMHDSSGHAFARFDGEQLWCDRVQTGFGPAAYIVTIKGYYSQSSVTGFGVISDDATIDYLITRDLPDGQATTEPMTSGGPATIRFRNCVFVAEGTSFVGQFRPTSALNGCTLEFDHCVFYHANFRPSIKPTTWSTGTLKVNNCIFAEPGNGIPIDKPAGVTYIGNNNVFMCNTSGSDDVTLQVAGAYVNTLTAWRAATGQDANSIVVPPAKVTELFSGTLANGDFRLGATGAGALAAALQAGPQQHWDWNARAAASGPPVAWPVIPLTLAEAEAYVENPSSWTF
jgi:hypothetical protein